MRWGGSNPKIKNILLVRICIKVKHIVTPIEVNIFRDVGPIWKAYEYPSIGLKRTYVTSIEVYNTYLVVYDQSGGRMITPRKGKIPA